MFHIFHGFSYFFMFFSSFCPIFVLFFLQIPVEPAKNPPFRSQPTTTHPKQQQKRPLQQLGGRPSTLTPSIAMTSWKAMAARTRAHCQTRRFNRLGGGVGGGGNALESMSAGKKGGKPTDFPGNLG